MEKSRVWKGIRIGSIVVFWYVVISFLMLLFFAIFGHTSGECTSLYWIEAERGCLFAEDIYYWEGDQSTEFPEVGVFLTESDMFHRGGGCGVYTMGAGILKIRTKIHSLRFEFLDSELYLNSKPFRDGVTKEWKNYVTLHPWIFMIVQVENHGKVPICDNEEYGSMYYITGVNAPDISFEKGLFFLILSVILWRYSSGKMKWLKRIFFLNQRLAKNMISTPMKAGGGKKPE